MMESIKPIAEAITYILVGLMGVGMVLSKLGLFSLGKKKDHDQECPEPDCKRDVITIKEKTTMHDKQIAELFQISKQNAENFAYIKGRLEGAKIISLED